MWLLSDGSSIDLTFVEVWIPFRDQFTIRTDIAPRIILEGATLRCRNDQRAWIFDQRVSFVSGL